MSDKKELKRTLKRLEAQGWRLRKGKGGHTVAYCPDKSWSPVVIASTPSDHRAWKNTLTELKKRGYDA